MKRWYSFILGRTSVLSRAEIERILRTHTSYTVCASTERFLIIQCTSPLTIPSLMSTLGGTIKIGEGIMIKNIADVTPEDFARLLMEQCAGTQKIFFGCSMYGALPRALAIRALGLSIKSILKTRYARSSRHVSSREDALSSVVVATNKLLSERGADLQFLPYGDTLYIARTRAVQEFADFSARDFGRPKADPHSGMLPPKVARIMVNLSQLPSAGTLLDPFCGSGTVLMEAAMLNPLCHLIGSDISERAIKDTEHNMRWLQKKYPSVELRHLTLLQKNITALPHYLKPHSVDAIVTEPYLGPPQRDTPTLYALQQLIANLNPLYENALRVFSELIKPKGRVVMVWPVFIHQKNQLELPAFHTIERLFAIEPLTADSPTALYARPDQKVARRICVLTGLTPKI